MPKRYLQMLVKVVSLILALSLTGSLGFFLPVLINRYNDDTFGNITILDTPRFLKALKDVQNSGVNMCIHGWRHEDFSTLTATEAKNYVEKGLEIFKQAGLTPVAFLSPYKEYVTLPPSIRAAIESTGIATRLPVLQTNGSRVGSYGWGWRTMDSYDDQRYYEAVMKITSEQPTVIQTHVEDWNGFLKKLISDYLLTTPSANITIRVDDFEVNTPAEVVYDIAELKNMSSVGLIAYGVVPSGTWRGGDPTIFGVSVNTIFNVYWFFFLTTAFLPFSFLLFWRGLSRGYKKNKKGNAPADDPRENRKHDVSIIVPAYNEEKNIGKCIEGILKQEFSGKVDIIIVNDGSTDRTQEIASKYPVHLINLPTNRGKAYALNAGIEQAKGDIIIFSDADSEMSKHAVTSLVNCLDERPDVEAVAGNVLIKNSDREHSLLRVFQEIEYALEQEISRFLQSIGGGVLVCPGPLFAVRQETAKAIMFRDNTVVEDADFTLCVLKKSLKVVRIPEASVKTNAPKTLKAWINQRKRWWYGNLQVWRIHNGWARNNPWMVLNYFSFPASIFSIILMLLLPYLFSTYDNVSLIILRGVPYVIVPWILFIVFTIPLFIKKKKALVLMLLPYYLIYGTLKMVLLAYLYVRYLFRLGVNVSFGSRILRVK